MSTYSKFYFRPGRGEQVNTVITPLPEERSAVCGRVVDTRGLPVSDALVLLFRNKEGAAPELISRFLTDEDGQFFFGPLEPEMLYIIKVFKNNIKIRELEILAD